MPLAMLSISREDIQCIATSTMFGWQEEPVQLHITLISFEVENALHNRVRVAYPDPPALSSGR
jgi:hypothetical protein